MSEALASLCIVCCGMVVPLIMILGSIAMIAVGGSCFNGAEWCSGVGRGAQIATISIGCVIFVMGLWVAAVVYGFCGKKKQEAYLCGMAFCCSGPVLFSA